MRLRITKKKQKRRGKRQEKNCCNFPADDRERSVTVRHSSKTRLVTLPLVSTKKHRSKRTTGIFIIGHRPRRIEAASQFRASSNAKFVARARPSQALFLSLSLSFCVLSLCDAIKRLSTQNTACRGELLHCSVLHRDDGSVFRVRSFPLPRFASRFRPLPETRACLRENLARVNEKRAQEREREKILQRNFCDTFPPLWTRSWKFRIGNSRDRYAACRGNSNSCKLGLRKFRDRTCFQGKTRIEKIVSVCFSELLKFGYWPFNGRAIRNLKFVFFFFFTSEQKLKNWASLFLKYCFFINSYFNL